VQSRKQSIVSRILRSCKSFVWPCVVSNQIFSICISNCHDTRRTECTICIDCVTIRRWVWHFTRQLPLHMWCKTVGVATSKHLSVWASLVYYYHHVCFPIAKVVVLLGSLCVSFPEKDHEQWLKIFLSYFYWYLYRHPFFP